MADPCPLCRTIGAPIRGEFQYAAIWDALGGAWGITFPQDVIARNTPESTTALAECENCGLQFFSPVSPGDPSFYACLTGSAYYGPRWEFDVVGGQLRRDDAVADFGCGDGTFLRQVRSGVRRAVGVDHNPAVAERLAAANIEFAQGDLGRFADDEPATLDVVCAFQILEHLPDARDLLDPATRCLRPGGRLFISVPNRERFGRRDLEPLDCPPHHVSRWAPEQLRTLAHDFGMELRGLHRQPPEFSFACMYRERQIERRVRPVLGARLGHRVARAVRKLTFGKNAYRRASQRGRFAAANVYGHTMLAELRLPGR